MGGIDRFTSFKISLLFAPLAYAFHHLEESIIFNFRAWRSLYFPDNQLPSTELMLVILMVISLVYIILHFIVQNKASAQSVITFLMATQVNNMIFHAPRFEEKSIAERETLLPHRTHRLGVAPLTSRWNTEFFPLEILKDCQINIYKVNDTKYHMELKYSKWSILI